MTKPKLFISACLIGQNTRYDGKNKKLNNLEQLKEQYELIAFCPEVEGGLTTPRLPCEIVGNRVINVKNEDKTSEYTLGVKKALDLILSKRIKKALLKDKSPACGVYYIYDGSFNGKLIKGQGITTKAFLKNGVKVYNEEEILELLKE